MVRNSLLPVYNGTDILGDIEIMPLIYNALTSDSILIVEKALSVVPGLASTLDYTVRLSSLSSSSHY
jgi:hypothetical protein